MWWKNGTIMSWKAPARWMELGKSLRSVSAWPWWYWWEYEGERWWIACIIDYVELKRKRRLSLCVLSNQWAWQQYRQKSCIDSVRLTEESCHSVVGLLYIKVPHEVRRHCADTAPIHDQVWALSHNGTHSLRQLSDFVLAVVSLKCHLPQCVSSATRNKWNVLGCNCSDHLLLYFHLKPVCLCECFMKYN